MLATLGKDEVCVAEGTGVRFVRSFGEGSGIGGDDCRKRAGAYLGTVDPPGVSPLLSSWLSCLPYLPASLLSQKEVEGLALGKRLSCCLKAKGFEILSGESPAMNENEKVGMTVV